MSIPDYQYKLNKGCSELSTAKKRIQSKRKGNATRIPKIVEACDRALEAVKTIREGAMDEAKKHIEDLGTSSSLYTWLHGVDAGDLIVVRNPHDDRLQWAEGEVFDTYEKDGEEIAMVYLYPPHERNIDIESVRLDVQETGCEVTDAPQFEFEEGEEVTVTKEGKYKGATGRVVDTDRWKGSLLYLVHVFAPHDVMQEFSPGEIKAS